MVKYYGRAKTRVGSVNTTQLGLKMSGCPSKVGLSGQNNRYIQQRVSCMRGICGIPLVNGAIWRHTLRNKHPFCAEPSHKCLAAAGGIGNINTPYYKTLQAGKEGCGYGHPASGDKHRAFPDGLKLTAGKSSPAPGLAPLVGYWTPTVAGSGSFGALQPNTVRGGQPHSAGTSAPVFQVVSLVSFRTQSNVSVLLVGLTSAGGVFPVGALFPFSRLIIRNSRGEIEASISGSKFTADDIGFVAKGTSFAFTAGSTYTIQFIPFS